MSGREARDRKGKGAAVAVQESSEEDDVPVKVKRAGSDDEEKPAKKRSKPASGKADKRVSKGRGNTASQPAAGNVRGLAPQAEEVEDEEDGEALFAPLLDVEKMAEDYQAEAERLCQHAHVASISSQDRDGLVADVMRLMLFRRHKDGAPVGRAELNAVVNKLYKDKRQLAPAVVALAQARFLGSLGMEMKELTKAKRNEQGLDVKKRVAAAAQEAAGTRVFVLRSVLPRRLRSAYVDLPEEKARRGFTLTVLALVALGGDAGLPEETLWGQLEQLGVPKAPKAEPHPQLGDADAALQLLVKQHYLQRNKCAGPDGERWVLELAENALDEFGRDHLLAFVNKLVKARSATAAADDEDEA